MSCRLVKTGGGQDDSGMRTFLKGPLFRSAEFGSWGGQVKEIYL